MKIISKVFFLNLLSGILLSFSFKKKQVPKANDLKNHFGSSITQNLYGPEHFLNKDSFLNENGSLLVNYDSEDKIVITSGKTNINLRKAAGIVAPLIPVDRN